MVAGITAVRVVYTLDQQPLEEPGNQGVGVVLLTLPPGDPPVGFVLPIPTDADPVGLKSLVSGGGGLSKESGFRWGGELSSEYITGAI